MARKVSLARTSLALVIAGLPILAGAQTPPAGALTPTQPPSAHQPSPPVAAPSPTATPAPAATPTATVTPTPTAPPPAANQPPPPPTVTLTPTQPPPLAAPPPPPPLPPEPVFYYDDGGKAAGPFNLADLRAKVAAGVIGPTTLVWKSGTPAWVAAKNLADLSSSFAPAAAAPPPTPILPPATGQPGPVATNIRSFFFGTWETDGPGPAGTQGLAKMVMTLTQDGSVQGTYTVSLAGAGATVSFPVTGKWNAAQISNNLASLTFNLVMRDANGQPEAVNSTTTVQIIDQDTIRDTTQGTITKRIKM